MKSSSPEEATIESAEGTIEPTNPALVAVTDLTDQQKARLTSYVNGQKGREDLTAPDEGNNKVSSTRPLRLNTEESEESLPSVLTGEANY